MPLHSLFYYLIGVGRACIIALLDIRNQNPCSRISTSKTKTLDRVRQGICEEVRSKREYREQSTRHRRSFDSSSNGHTNDISNNNINHNTITGNVPHNNVPPRRASDFRLWRSYTELSPIVHNDNIDNKKKINNKNTTGNKFNNRSIGALSNVGAHTNSGVLPLPSDINVEPGTGVDNLDDSKVKSPAKTIKSNSRSNSIKSCDPLGTDDEDDNPATAAPATTAAEDSPDSSSLIPIISTTAAVRSSATTTVPSIYGPRTTITAHTVTSIARALSASMRRPASTGRRPQSANATRTMSGLRRDETYGRSIEIIPLVSTGTGESQVNTFPNTDMGTSYFETIRSRPSTPNGMRRTHQSRPSSASYRSTSYSNPNSGPSSLGNTLNLSSTWGNSSSPNSSMTGNGNGNGNGSGTSGIGGTISGSARRYNSFSDIDYDRNNGRSSIFEGIAYAEKLHQQQQQSASAASASAQYPTQHIQQTVSSPKMSYYQVDFSEISANANTQRQSRQLPTTFKQDLTSRMNSSKRFREGSKTEKDRDKEKDRDYDNIKVDNDMKSTDEESIDNDLNNLIRNNTLFPREVSQQNNQASLFSLKNSVNVQKLMTDQDQNQNQNQNFDKRNTSEKSKELLSTTVTSNSSFNDLPSLDVKELNVVPILNKLSNSNTSQKIGKSSSLSTIPNSVICDNSNILSSSKKPEIKIFNTSLKSKNINNNNNSNDGNSTNTDNMNINRFEIDDNRNFKDYQIYLNSQKVQKDSLVPTTENSKLKIRSAEDILNFNYDNHIVGTLPGGKIKLGGSGTGIGIGTNSAPLPLPRRNSTNSLPSR